MKNKYKIFAGSANQKLAHDIGDSLHKTLGKMEVVTFSDSEKRVRIEESVKDTTIFVIASLSNPVDVNLIELCLIGDALKSNDCGKLIAVIPYYGYGRQDKAHRNGEGVSARVMARLIEAVGFDTVVTVDLHSDLVAGYFHKNVKHVFSAEIFVEKLQKYQNNLAVIAPDAGGAKRAQHFAHLLHAPLSFIEKKRSLEKIHKIDALRLVGDVGDKVTVLLDDVVTSGGTLIKAAKILKERGATKVIACVTHADFVTDTSKNLQRSLLDEVYVSDSIFVEPKNKFKKLHIVSLNTILAEEIRKII